MTLAATESGSSSSSDDGSLQCLFLGTGTSTGLPLVPCLTLTQPYPDEFARHLPLPAPLPNPPVGHYNPDGEWPSNIPCACCRAAVDHNVPDGWKNRRGNTSVVIRKKREGQWRNVVVDVGKTFREQSMRFFPRWGVTRIDAVILTHGHADAYFGLDDLREWCFRQQCIIPVYLNRETYETVAMSFPYLVDKTKASGGGDIPALRFHIIDDDADFEVEGIQVRALPVEHGIYFRDDKREPLYCLAFMFDRSIIYMSDVSHIPDRTWERMLDRTPPATQPESALSATKTGANGYMAQPKAIPRSFPERLKEKVVIPPTPQGTPGTSRSQSPLPPLASLTLSEAPRTGSVASGITPPHSDVPSSSSSSIALTGASETGVAAATTPASQTPHLPILIIDALWPIVRHSSHINFTTAVQIAMRLNPGITYLVDVVHPVSHYMWEELGRSLRGADGQQISENENGQPHPDDVQSRELVARYWADNGTQRVAEGMKRWGGRVEPGWDGLVVQVDKAAEGGWREVKGRGGSVGGFHI